MDDDDAADHAVLDKDKDADAAQNGNTHAERLMGDLCRVLRRRGVGRTRRAELLHTARQQTAGMCFAVSGEAESARDIRTARLRSRC